jgi:hypothetical protein
MFHERGKNALLPFDEFDSVCAVVVCVKVSTVYRTMRFYAA